VAEKIASIQDAATAVLNQLIDHGDLVLNLHGNWFYDGTMEFNPAKNIARMGQPIRVGNVDGIKLIDVGPIPQEHYNLYQLLKDMADLVTATSNPSLGKTTDTQKTLGEIQIVAGASNMIFEEHAARVARSWAKVWDQVRWLAAQFGENGEAKRRGQRSIERAGLLQLEMLGGVARRVRSDGHADEGGPGCNGSSQRVHAIDPVTEVDQEERGQEEANEHRGRYRKHNQVTYFDESRFRSIRLLPSPFGSRASRRTAAASCPFGR